MDRRTDAVRGKHHLALILSAIFFWGTSFTATKLAYQTFPPLTLGACRFAIALAALGLVARAKGQLFLPARRDFGIIALTGFLGITLYYGCENLGIKMLTASNAALIVSAMPALAIALEYLFYRTPVGKLQMAGVALSMFGVYWIATAGNGDEGQDANMLLGALLLVAAGVVWAFYNIATKSVVNRYPITTITFYQTAVGFLTFLPLAWWERGQWQTPTWETAGLLLYLSLFCSVAAFLFYNHGLRKFSAGIAAIMLNLIPVIGVALGVLVLKEQLFAGQVLGGLTAIVGVSLTVLKRPA